MLTFQNVFPFGKYPHFITRSHSDDIIRTCTCCEILHKLCFPFLKRPLSSTHVFKNVLKNIMFKKESSHFPLLYLKNPPYFPEIAKCPFSLISLLFPKQTFKHPFWIIPHRVIRPRTFSQMFLIFTKHPNIKNVLLFLSFDILTKCSSSSFLASFFFPFETRNKNVLSTSNFIFTHFHISTFIKVKLQFFS